MSAQVSQTHDIHRYDRISRLFHWSMAGLIFGLMALGLGIDSFPKSMKTVAIDLHVTFGALTMLLLVVRAAWRLSHPAPRLAETAGPLAVRLAKLGHIALYALTTATLVAGLATAFSRGLSIEFGFFSIPSPIAASRTLARSTKEVHEILSFALMGLVAIHVAAALWHEAVLRDGTMRRMMAPPSS